MSSTNKTTNLNLNQWVASDPVMREDFNADNTKIDTAVAAVSTALNAAVAAQPQIVTGSYTGNGAASRVISLSKTPKAVLVIMRCGYHNEKSYYARGLALPNLPMMFSTTEPIVSICTNGFQVYYKQVSSSTIIMTNGSNEQYSYIAIL